MQSKSWARFPRVNAWEREKVTKKIWDVLTDTDQLAVNKPSLHFFPSPCPFKKNYHNTYYITWTCYRVLLSPLHPEVLMLLFFYSWVTDNGRFPDAGGKEKHQTHNIAWKAAKETLTSTSCSNDTQQWEKKEKSIVRRDYKKKKNTPSQFYLFCFHSCVQTVGWFIAVMAAVKLSALNACWLRMHALVALLSGGQHKTFTEDYERLLTEDDLLPLPRAGGGPDLWGAHSLAVFTSVRRMPAPCHAHELWISRDIASQPRKGGKKKEIKN